MTNSQHKERKKLTERIKSEITLKFRGICQVCGKKGKIKIRMGCYYKAYSRQVFLMRTREGLKNQQYAFEIHHIIPIEEKGLTIEENLTLVCHKCHRSILHKRRYLI